MTAASRSAQFVKLHKTLKKFYKPVPPNPERPGVLEQLLFGCCLENAHYEKAEEAYAALVHTFFDWNEIRVTTVKELAEVMSMLPDPAAAAHRVRKVLQHVFESSYSFDLEDLQKKNLGQAVERLEKIAGCTRFAVAYVVQTSLEGHSIPLDSGTLDALKVLGVATEQEVAELSLPGLERAISKNKGVEFGSLLHQLGADFFANPFATALHKMLLQINPDCEPQLPKRRRVVEPPPAPVATPVAGEAEPKPKSRAKADPAVAAPPAASAPAAQEGAKGRRKKKDGESDAPAEPLPAPAAEASKAAAKEKDKPPARPAAKEKEAVKEPVKEKETAKEKEPLKEKEAAKGKIQPKGKAKEPPPPAESKPAVRKPASLKKPAAEAQSSGETAAGKRAATPGITKRKPR